MSRILSIILLFSGLSFSVSSQVFLEPFDEGNTSTTGTDNSGNAVGWTANCPSCSAGTDWLYVNGGQLEGRDTNGPAYWTTGVIDISSCNGFEISFDYSDLGDLEACNSACSGADWVGLSYRIDGGAWTAPPNAFFCGGCASSPFVILSGDPDLPGSGAYASTPITTLGCDLEVRLNIVTKAGSEYIRVDNFTVSCVTSIDAGTNGSVTVCDNGGSTDLINELGGSPDAGGTWTGPSALGGGDQGTFDHSVDNPGVYTYSVGNPSCPTTSTVAVTVDPLPDAGSNGSVTVCPTGASLDLINELGGSPDAGGSWSGPSALGGGDQGTYDPSTMSSGVYTYNVGSVICGASATVTVTEDGPSIDVSGLTISDENCGQTDGSITGITVSGGVGSYTYDWSGTGTPGPDYTNIGAGSYTLTVTDANGCTATSGPHTINNIPSPTIDVSGIVLTDENCGQANGSITGLTVSGGTTPVPMSSIYALCWGNNFMYRPQ